jgi:hypothetical protein
MEHTEPTEQAEEKPFYFCLNPVFSEWEQQPLWSLEYVRAESNNWRIKETTKKLYPSPHRQSMDSSWMLLRLWWLMRVRGRGQ